MNKQILKYVQTYYYLENRPILSLIRCDFVGKIAFLRLIKHSTISSFDSFQYLIVENL